MGYNLCYSALESWKISGANVVRVKKTSPSMEFITSVRFLRAEREQRTMCFAAYLVGTVIFRWNVTEATILRRLKNGHREILNLRSPNLQNPDESWCRLKVPM